MNLFPEQEAVSKEIHFILILQLILLLPVLFIYLFITHRCDEVFFLLDGELTFMELVYAICFYGTEVYLKETNGKSYFSIKWFFK